MAAPTDTPERDPLFAGLPAQRVVDLRRQFRIEPDLEEMLASGELQRLILAEPRIGLNLVSHLTSRFRTASAP